MRQAEEGVLVYPNKAYSVFSFEAMDMVFFMKWVK